MRVGRLCAGLLAALVLTACSRDSEWQPLAIADGGFSVLMRGQAHYVRQQVETPAGTLYAHLYSSDRPDAYFAVGYSDFPLAHIMTTSREALFEGVRASWVRRLEGRLVATGPTRLQDGYDGLAFTIEGRMKDADAWLEGRLYLVDQRLYQVIALGRRGEIAQGTVNRFLNSFRIRPDLEGSTVTVEPPRQ